MVWTDSFYANSESPPINEKEIIIILTSLDLFSHLADHKKQGKLFKITNAEL